MANYKQTSVYANTPINDVALGVFDPPEINITGNEKTIVLDRKYQYRPDLLSTNLYGTPRLWWVFKMLNSDKLNDPIWDFKTGIELLVPIKAELGSYIT